MLTIAPPVPFTTHYEILGVSEGATSAEIKQNYQRLLLTHHPDKLLNTRSPIEGISLHNILEAWKVLGNPEARKAYDAQLKATKLKQDGLVNAEVDLDDMEYDEDTRSFSTQCRCGGLYAISEPDMEQGADIIGCGNCSLRIRVLYEVVEEYL